MRVIFHDSDGTVHLLDGEPGESAMACAKRHLVFGIIGECGGVMACATCHAYVEEPWASRLPAPSQQERDMLEGCIDVRANSRLSCQISLAPALDGIVLTVPASQV